MKTLIIIALLLSVGYVSAQTTSEQLLAQKIADKMKLELNLNHAQRDSILHINLQLSGEKKNAWAEHKDTRLAQELQRIEKKRDSLYRAVFTSDSQYQMYKQKKFRIVSGD
jgi:hypothetical protein